MSATTTRFIVAAPTGGAMKDTAALVAARNWATVALVWYATAMCAAIMTACA
jgi:hypothetical protein